MKLRHPTHIHWASSLGALTLRGLLATLRYRYYSPWGQMSTRTTAPPAPATSTPFGTRCCCCQPCVSPAPTSAC
jgi:hypothetical protein